MMLLYFEKEMRTNIMIVSCEVKTFFILLIITSVLFIFFHYDVLLSL
jgi:hypothetical protein